MKCNKNKRSGNVQQIKCAHDLFEILVEYFWFHEDPAIQKSFREYTRFREREEDKYPDGAFQESAELLEKEAAFSSLLFGLEHQAYLLFRQALNQVEKVPCSE